MASLVSSSLSESFRTVPSPAVPAMLDCIISSTGISASSLFDSLLPDFSNLTKVIFEKSKKMDSDQCSFLMSYLRGLSHLMNKMRVNSVALECFIWEAFIPLMKMVQFYEREMLHEVVDSLLQVVNETSNWELIHKTLIPLLLRSVGLSMNMDRNQDKSAIQWTRWSVFQSSRMQEFDSSKCDNIPLLPLTLSCYLMSCLLDSATEKFQGMKSGFIPRNAQEEAFCDHLLWDLCELTIQLLSQSLEHRSCTASLLLPSIFKAFASKCSFEVCIQGESCNISRQHFFMKLWNCSQALFSQGLTERRDAYGIISLYLSFFPSASWSQVGMDDSVEGFDIRAEKEFWDQIRRGLVEKEGLIRKQSLYILKKVLLINDEQQLNPTVSEKKSLQRTPVPHGMTKRDFWAEEEAKSLGVGRLSLSTENNFSEKEKWEAFILLYEMLDEYGTHLVEAAWNHQILLLLQSCVCHESFMDFEASNQQIDVLGGNVDWLAILWERGLFHDNPHVRCLIMKSFLDINWKNQGNCRLLFSEEFVLGAFIQGLNDPVHHKEFGHKGVLSSNTIKGGSKFMYQYSSFLHRWEQISFLCKLASVARQLSLGRAGFMSLSECICSASVPSKFIADEGYDEVRVDPRQCMDVSLNGMQYSRDEHCADKTNLIDSLRFLVESSKQHFNPNYRLKVCENVLEAAVSVVCPDELSLETILHFIAALPREFTDIGGSLRTKVKQWFAGNHLQSYAASSNVKVDIPQSICDFPKQFTSNQYFPNAGVQYDDEDLTAWSAEAERWARVLFLHAVEEHQLEPVFMFLEKNGIAICQQSSLGEWIPVKFLMLLLSLVHELEVINLSTDKNTKVVEKDSKAELNASVDKDKNYLVAENFGNVFLVILEDLILFAESSCLIFSSHAVVETKLPGSVTGKLGGPSRRRLSTPMTTAVLQAIMSVRTVATVSSWCSHIKEDARLNFAFSFLWKSFHMVISSAVDDCETSAEICLAAYEALSFALKASVPVISSLTVNFIKDMGNPVNTTVEIRPLLDSLVWTFLNHINSFLAVQQLARTRRAVLMNWKWLCLEAILSIPYNAFQNGIQLGDGNTFFSDDAVRFIFGDLVESLETAGEDSALSMLRSVRMVLDLLTSSSSFVSTAHGVDAQMMWQLVRSSWILHTSCNKRRVAPIAALLSAVLHASVFSEEEMHVAGDGPGPLKWFCEKVLEEGMKSPRTIRLAALHLSGLWLFNPRVVKYYMKELKLLTLYGSVAFDEDFEAELTENGDARTEVSLLAQIPDREIVEVYINTELFARVSVSVLFYKLGELAVMAGSGRETDDSFYALESGKVFLLELLDAAVNDKDLSKELYKKYSAVHRRKVRAWQMLCVLSRFVRQDIARQVMQILSVSLYRNNLPSVRQYMETFAIQVYLKFPFLVREHLVSILCDYSMKTQALSSYVYIAANVMIHAEAEVQPKHLDELLPPIMPLLTSHHHTLRGFTQLLVYQVFCKLLPTLDSTCCKPIILEKRCFSNLKSYLESNPDCARLRASMEGYLDAFSPVESATPAGIFTSRVEDMEFECVPLCLTERVMNFLNNVREELRSSMAKDDAALKNEDLMIAEKQDCAFISANAGQERLPASPLSNILLDFQKKFTLAKHEIRNDEMEKEDQLFEQILQSRIISMEKLKANRQQLILVASFIGRIPNLAGLARTCEVFKASSLAIADVNVLQDKQFQLISVTADKWVPIIEVPVNSVKIYVEKKKREGFAILGLEQTANSISLDKYSFPQKTVLVLGREKEGIPADIIHILDACIEIPQLGVVRSLNVHDDSFVSRNTYQGTFRDYNEITIHKEMIGRQHDVLLETLLDSGSFTKLYSYTHLINGFAIHVTSNKAVEFLRNAKGVKAIHEDIKMQKLTTHTPDYLGIPTGVWPDLGGARSSGEGVVIGMIDTGINPDHPSFANLPSVSTKGSMDDYSSRFRGKCASGEMFPPTACNGKIVGAQYFARAAIAAGDFNATRDYASPYDADGHGSHTASTAAGNYETPVIVNGFNYGNASGMAPGASIAVYKALYTFGGYMSDVVAAVDQAVEDGVDILSLSVGPSSVPPGPSAFLNVLEMELLFATKSGVVVIQAAGNGGPSSSSILSFSPWITTVAASITDRKYNNSIVLGNGHSLSGMGLAPPTPGQVFFPMAAAADVSRHNASIGLLESCQTPDAFIPSLVRGKLIICTYTFDFEFDSASIVKVAETMHNVGAAGFIMTMDPDVGSEEIKGTTVTLGVPGIVLNNLQASTALWQYYNSRTFRGRTGRVLAFSAIARIMDGRQAMYTGQAPIVASYSSRGPDVNNALLQTADVLKPTIMAPGSSIWAAWSPNSEGDRYAKGQNFALVSGTSMATPHVAGVAALIKHKHPNWKPSAIVSAMMTTTDIADSTGNPIMAQKTNQLAPATPFDFGVGSINPTRAVDPGLVFISRFKNYVQFLCSVPGVDDESVKRSVGVGCPTKRGWCSDLNTPTITISNLVGSRKVVRVVTNVGEEPETYSVTVKPPMGVRVKVTPKSFTVSHNATRQLKLVLEATDATNNYSFGEMLLRGNKGHVARVPITILVSSVLGN